MLGNWCIEMFSYKFSSIVPSSVIKVIIEEPSCTGSSESIQVFKHFNQLSSQSSLYKADEIKALDSLVAAVVYDFRNHLCMLFSVSFPFYQCLALNVGTRLSLHVRDVGGLSISIMGGSVLCLCTWNREKWTPVLCLPFCSFPLFGFSTWGLWWWWFLDPAVDLLSATVDWTCYSCFACCCVRCASQNIYLYWNSFATCSPTQQVYWYLPGVPLCHQGF